MKKFIRIASVILCVLLLSALLFACNDNGNTDKPQLPEHDCNHTCPVCNLCVDPTCTEKDCANKCSGHVTPTAYKISLDFVGGKVDLHTELQQQCLDDTLYMTTSYANGSKELSKTNELKLAWKTEAVTDNVNTVIDYTVELTTDPTFNKDVWTFSSFDNDVNVHSLKIATKYYWRVTANLDGGATETSDISVLVTAECGPRMINVDGVTNVRDLGGWQTTDGTRVKQGLLYRCGRLNKSSSTTVRVEITDKGKDFMLDYLGVKSEMDLRMVSNNEVGGLTYTSPLGESVKYLPCPMDYNTSNLIIGNSKQIVRIFRYLADPSMYPMIFHCNIGTDRTGLIAFLVGGLCGVPEDTLYRDYLMSNFGNIGSSRTVFTIQDNYVYYIKESDGETLAEKTYNCLLATGVPAEHLDAVIGIMTGEIAIGA